MKLIRFTRRGMILLCLLSLSLGCGEKRTLPPLGQVTGKVTLNGEPLRKVEVCFSPTKGRPSYGTTNDEGKYELVYVGDVKGAKVGEHRITIYSQQVDNSQLKPVTIKEGEQTIDITCTANPNPPNPEEAGET